MSIALQIRIITLLLISASLGFGYSFLTTTNSMKSQREVNEVVQLMIKGMFELNIVTNEYITSKNKRIEIQWNQIHNSLEALFVEADPILIYEDDKLSLKKILSNELQAEALFFTLIDEQGSKKDKPSKVDNRKSGHMTSQIQVRIQSMLSEASRMSRRSLERLAIAEKELEYVSMALLFLLWPIFIISFILIDRKVIKPLTLLQKSAKNLSSGDYETRIEVTGHNEVSALARSYNELAIEIQKKITALTDKSLRLNESQDKLLNLNQNLQIMIDEQTADLRNSETRQRAVLESMNDAVITLDETFTIKNINHAVGKLFGYSDNEIINKNINILLSSSINNGQLKSYQESEGINANNDLFPIEITLNEMWLGDVLMYTAIIRDITERKRADKMKNEFVSTVSHELRTPLTSIRGSLGLVINGIMGDIPTKAHDVLAIAERNTNRLMRLINDILDLQKIEAGKLEFNFSRVDLMDVIEKSVIDNQSYAEQYQVNIQLNSRLKDITVTTDAHRLAQVMANLLSNAAKFSFENGTVDIQTEVCDDFAKISVIDHGEGIPEEFHDQIFSKFSQNDSTSTRQKGGTGLGLAITKTMIEKMGGNIDFTSVIGEGTTFNIYIPLKHEL